MWNKIILREKISLYSDALKEKLFFLNDNLRSVILNVRKSISELEDMRIVGFSSGSSLQDEATYTLDKFRKLQFKNRAKIK